MPGIRWEVATGRWYSGDSDVPLPISHPVGREPCERAVLLRAPVSGSGGGQPDRAAGQHELCRAESPNPLMLQKNPVGLRLVGSPRGAGSREVSHETA